MSLTSAMVDALLAVGGTAEQLAALVKADMADKEAAREAKRANNAERQRRYRERHNADNALRDVTACDSVTDPALSRPPNEINSNPPTHTHPDKIPTRARADDFPCPEGVDATDWAGLKANRKAKRAALTEGAHRQIVRKLEGWARDGWPPGPIVAAAVERGWTTVFETDEMKAGTHGRSPLRAANDFTSLRGARPNPALDMLLQAERELQAEAECENPRADRPARLALPPGERGGPEFPPGDARAAG